MRKILCCALGAAMAILGWSAQTPDPAKKKTTSGKSATKSASTAHKQAVGVSKRSESGRRGWPRARPPRGRARDPTPPGQVQNRRPDRHREKLHRPPRQEGNRAASRPPPGATGNWRPLRTGTRRFRTPWRPKVISRPKKPPERGASLRRRPEALSGVPEYRG